MPASLRVGLNLHKYLNSSLMLRVITSAIRKKQRLMVGCFLGSESFLNSEILGQVQNRYKCFILMKNDFKMTAVTHLNNVKINNGKA